MFIENHTESNDHRATLRRRLDFGVLALFVAMAEAALGLFSDLALFVAMAEADLGLFVPALGLLLPGDFGDFGVLAVLTIAEAFMLFVPAFGLLAAIAEAALELLLLS